MKKRSKILVITGYVLLLISCLLFITILIVPWFDFSRSQIAGITTALIIAGEIFFYLSMFILGKSIFDKIKSRLKFWKSKTKEHSVPGQNDQKQNP